MQLDFQIDWVAVSQGLKASFYGLSGVFLVLILFYVVTKLMLKISVSLTKKN